MGDLSTELSGNLTVDTNARSYARSLVGAPTVSVGAVNANVNYIDARAKGTYSAYVDSGSNTAANLKAHDISVSTTYHSNATATGGSSGAAVGLANVDVNVTKAFTTLGSK